MKPSRFFFAVVFLGVVTSGCVKERRGYCPCRLHLDLSALDTSLVSSVRVRVAGPGGFVFDSYADSSLFQEELIVRVPKGDCRLNVYSGECGMSEPEGGLRIPLGAECPPVYMQSSYLDTDCELLTRQVALKKNYCRLSIYVEDAEHFPFALAVRGRVSGYDQEGKPAVGEFFYGVESVSDVDWVLSVPRQVDDSMLLEVSDDTAVLKTFALGEYINASGYDWNAADLQDITIGIDYTRTKLSVSIRGWDEVYEFDVVI